MQQTDYIQISLFGKMSRDPYHHQEENEQEKTSELCWKCFATSKGNKLAFLELSETGKHRDGANLDTSTGMDGRLRGGFSTLNTGESPSIERESSLLSILEENPHPKYFLSKKAAIGIINRSAKHGKMPLGEMIDALNDIIFDRGKTNCHIRKPTPLEAERLMGFPDEWTNIGDWIDTNGKRHKQLDSHRYKALGNSIPIPVFQFVMDRIFAHIDDDNPTLGSLFDGIGGFPLCAQRAGINPVWASEIEEFPIAVTKARFPEAGGENEKS